MALGLVGKTANVVVCGGSMSEGDDESHIKQLKSVTLALVWVLGGMNCGRLI
jgi:hypothetical protein